MRSQPQAISEILATAIWLAERGLDASQGTNQTAIATLAGRLVTSGVPDQATAERRAERTISASPQALEAVDLLAGCPEVFEMVRGLPVLAPTALARTVARIVDPDVLVTLHPDLHLPAGEDFGWGAIPLTDHGGCVGILREGSVDTHIHLGGVLPPIFYWVAVMSCELPLERLRFLRSQRLDTSWDNELLRDVACAAWTRVRLAAEAAESLSDTEWDQCFTPELCKEMVKLRQPATALSSVLELRQAVLSFTHRWRFLRTAADWPFADPLRKPREGLGGRPHYAEGERRMLHLLGRRIRRLREDGSVQEAERLDARLLWYLRVRNTFHRLLIHDAGSDGLLTFNRSFGRRSLVSESGRRSSRRRFRRTRRTLLALERARMAAACTAQLTLPFQRTNPQAEPPLRGIEVRLSLSRGAMALRTFRAWLQGAADHVDWHKGHGVPCNSRLGFVVHFIKKGHDDQNREEAEATVRHLMALLADFPWLRPYVVGLDAAGQERSSSPRVFGPAFQRMEASASRFRVIDHIPEISLGYTFHVGEDVPDLLTGLRHMDEVITLLLPKDGGRLGHALALADDPSGFYNRRGGYTEPPVTTHLLDLVWAWSRLNEVPDLDHSGRALERISRAIFRCARDHCQGATSITKDSIRRCADKMEMELPQNHGSNGPRTIRSERELLDELGVPRTLRWSQTLTIRPDDTELELLGVLQRWLRTYASRQRICLEVNPTSNLIVNGYRSYADLPYHTLVDDDLPVSLNTDDPGLFMTTLAGEFTAMYHALLEKGLSHRRALDWLHDRTDDARRSTFLGVQVPLLAQALQDDPQAVDRILRYDPTGAMPPD